MAQFSANEQLLLELINRARLDPAGEAARFGIALNAGLTPGQLTATAKQALAPNNLLVDAARAHSQWMIDTDIFDHTGVDGSDPGDRMRSANYVFTGNWTWGENIAWSGTTGTPNATAFTIDIHQNLFESPGHRVNILEGSFRELGTGVLTGAFTDGLTYNAVMVTENFATSGPNVFVTGVAYNDLDGDRFYDPGEARASVAVTVTSGPTILGSDVTEPAGGYSVGVLNTNATVRFSGGGLAAPVTVTLYGGASNAKADLVGASSIFSSASAALGTGATALHLLGVANLNGTGNAANNTIYGNSGANVLNGGAGADTMSGGLGDDRYYIDNAGDVIVEAVNSGNDFAYASVSYTVGANVERLYLTGTGNINATAGDGTQILVGNSGINVLNGGLGADNMQGGLGDDRYFVDTAGDIIIEAVNAGNDFAYASVSYLLPANVERLYLTGTANLNGSGGTGTQLLFGNSGANILNGGLGADNMQGGLGDDRYYVDNSGDIVVEAANAGNDFIYATASYTLGANIERLYLREGSGNLNGTGNAQAEMIFGNSGANVLNGKAGNDTLVGGLGTDTFVFDTALSTALNTDRITDFSAADDTIRLENAVFVGLAAGNLAAGVYNTGPVATQADDRIIYDSANGNLWFDQDGLGGTAGIRFAVLSTGLTLSASDFVVV